MALYKPTHSNVWQTRFQIRGKTYRKSTGETDITKARLFEVAYKKQCKADVANNVKGAIKVHKALDEFLKTKSKSTNYPNYKKSVEVLKSFFFSQLDLHDVTYQQLEEFVDREVLDDYANATINHRLQTLSSSIDLARKRRHTVPDVEMPKLPTTKGRTRVLSDEEMKAIGDALADTAQNKYMGEQALMFRQDARDMFTILCGTGARFQEVSRLEWSQIDLKKRTVRLYRSKVDNEMALDMTTSVYECLLRRSEPKQHARYVFLNRAGTGPRGYSARAINKAIDRAGLGAEVTPHVLRHSIATKLHDAGMPLMQVQYVMGHASIQTTARYIHTSKQRAASEASRILNGR